jgi:hypothetical protein
MNLPTSEASVPKYQESEQRRPSSNAQGRGLAQGLAAFSIALGLAELVLTRGVARLVGVREDPDTHTVLRAAGARELTSGLGILMQPQRPSWVWSRVAGDAMDLTLLALAALSPTTRRPRLALASAAVLGVTLLDVGCALALERNARQVV